ncbi:hypothetical protein CFC21_042118 [Triticum aestivum]|uniref:CASP-like protein n=2 Tax=Triticum aestivum TaxID=4565 RepID=A0A3B6FPA9_WHEAT|nr:CASP-like protein 3A1 isoform X1 [Triticum aestivum]KAF7030606.1 hypothetical protein CFC21_042118 [Triticum aestivum]
MGSFANGQNGSELGIQMPAMGSSAVLEPPTTSVTPRCPRLDMAMVATRAAALVMALLSMSLMVSARQRGNLIIFGIEIPLYAKWSLSDSLKSLVGISAAAAAYSLAQLLSIAYKALKKVPAVPSRRYAWMLLAGDQEYATLYSEATFREQIRRSCSMSSQLTYNINRQGNDDRWNLWLQTQRKVHAFFKMTEPYFAWHEIGRTSGGAWSVRRDCKTA